MILAFREQSLISFYIFNGWKHSEKEKKNEYPTWMCVLQQHKCWRENKLFGKNTKKTNSTKIVALKIASVVSYKMSSDAW